MCGSATSLGSWQVAHDAAVSYVSAAIPADEPAIPPPPGVLALFFSVASALDHGPFGPAFASAVPLVVAWPSRLLAHPTRLVPLDVSALLSLEATVGLVGPIPGVPATPRASFPLVAPVAGHAAIAASAATSHHRHRYTCDEKAVLCGASAQQRW